jgi:signal transduction histidine kinase
VLLDAAPTPLLGIQGATVRALNRAARRQFATDDRILPVPAELLDRDASHLRHEGRSWRIDRVDVTDAGPARMVVALIDIEQEERAAEARATAEMIHVLGHELLNGLAPIVSLAESGLAAVGIADRDPALLPEILGTLARRAEGLQRFTEAYRALARLPAPSVHPVSVCELTEDLARLFAGRWPGVALSVSVADNLSWAFDRDQVSQAIWSLLQNATEAASADPDRLAQVSLRARGTKAGLEIEIGDNGDGVPADSVERIFRPFHSTKPEGTGIGLSLARQIAHAHGGTLAFEPAPATVFRLVLPER